MRRRVPVGMLDPDQKPRCPASALHALAAQYPAAATTLGQDPPEYVWDIHATKGGVCVWRPMEPHARTRQAPEGGISYSTKCRDAAEALFALRGSAELLAHADRSGIVQLVDVLRRAMLREQRALDDAVVLPSPFGSPVVSYATSRGAEAAEV